ncbi:hypothetical protein ACFX15_008827 [Malus domestica]
MGGNVADALEDARADDLGFEWMEGEAATLCCGGCDSVLCVIFWDFFATFEDFDLIFQISAPLLIWMRQWVSKLKLGKVANKRLKLFRTTCWQ